MLSKRSSATELISGDTPSRCLQAITSSLAALLLHFTTGCARTPSHATVPPATPSPAANLTETPTQSAAGYRGIWFTLGQFYGPKTNGVGYGPSSRQPVFPYGDKYSGGLGTYTAKHRPLAIYRPEVHKTFFVYGGTTAPEDRYLLCMASFYDHATHQVPRPTIVHDKQGVDDPHDNPSLCIDEQGYLYLFVSGRARHRPGYKYRSVEPYSTRRFEQISEEEMTYPQPHALPQGGFINLFTKYTGVRELYFETSTNGYTWTPDRKLAGIQEPGHSRGGHYQVSAIKGNLLGTFFNRHPEGHPDRRTDVYYAQTTDAGRTWTTVDNRQLTLPLTNVDNAARVIDYASQGLNVYLKDMDFDRQDHPVFLYLTSPGHQPGPPNDPRLWRLTRWDGQTWTTTTICRSDHNYDMGSLYLGESRWQIIAPTLPGPQPYHGGGELVLWESLDEGATWEARRALTHHSQQNHNYARRPLNARDPFFAFWADGDPTTLSPSHLYFGDSAGENVWRLPYSMSDNTAKPERLISP